MFRNLAAAFILLILPVWVNARQGPLSPPARPPVPLTDSDQERSRADELKKNAPQSAPVQQSVEVKVPVAAAGRHISSGNAAVDALVHEAAAQNGLDPCLIFSVMRAESSFNRMAVSPKGASGLMQLMPETAARFGVKNIFDPRENVLAGAKYLRWLLNRFDGDVRLALAGYNAGEGAVEFYGLRIPPFLETQNYVRIIYSRYSGIHLTATPTAVATEALKPAEQPKEKLPTYNQIIRFTSSTTDATAKSGK
ncbi:MAG TPA: lytic transglycosylase domain-containing protein [Blastocatellia bacterium]|nr:lytic transglycosylase domain-containing protein [Blastocatellia bacterium]